MHPHTWYDTFFKTRHIKHVWRATNSSWNREPPFSPKTTFEKYIKNEKWYFCLSFSLFTYKSHKKVTLAFTFQAILLFSCMLKLQVPKSATPGLWSFTTYIHIYMGLPGCMVVHVHCHRVTRTACIYTSMHRWSAEHQIQLVPQYVC